MRHVAYLLNTSGLAVQNSLYEEGTAANSKRKSGFGDNEVTSKLQMHTSQQTHRLWHSCFCALDFVHIMQPHHGQKLLLALQWHVLSNCVEAQY